MSIVFEEQEDQNRSFFSEIIASISDVRFSRNGKYVLSRDYLTVKLWDVAMESRPVEVYPVHDYLRSRLCSLYENDSIFDKFECGFNGDDRYGQPLIFCLYSLLSLSSLLAITLGSFPYLLL